MSHRNSFQRRVCTFTRTDTAVPNISTRCLVLPTATRASHEAVPVGSTSRCPQRVINSTRNSGFPGHEHHDINMTPDQTESPEKEMVTKSSLISRFPPLPLPPFYAAPPEWWKP